MPKKQIMPPSPTQPVKMLYEYSYDELPPHKKLTVQRMLRIYLEWVISQSQFADEHEEPLKSHKLHQKS